MARTAVVVSLVFTLTLAAGAQDTMSPARRARRELVAGATPGAAHGDLAEYRPALLRVYADSAPQLLWFAGDALSPQGDALLRELVNAETRGLRPADYDAAALTRAIASAQQGRMPAGAATLWRTDMWLTLSAMRFMDHAHRGRADPRTLGFAMPREHGHHDFAALALALGRSPHVHQMLDSLEPTFARFRQLEELLGRYRALAASGVQLAVPRPRTTLRAGMSWEHAPALRRFLAATSDLAAVPATADSERIDDALSQALRKFQARHGLAPDGAIGPATMDQLLVPLGRRVTQIELTMERWRWLPDITARRIVVVNIPAFRLYAIDRSTAATSPAERMDVIVGSAYGGRRTPVFARDMREVVFHPYWDVPAGIARREEVPRIRRDAGYADREGLEIVQGGDVGAKVFPITSDNLSRVSAGTLRLRQRPGPRNALGPVKFVFPNQYNVYLHGTPAQSLFARARRDFSHGCIRTSNPRALAEFVLAGQAGWDRARIAEQFASEGATLRVALDAPVPVFILYATAVAADDGTSRFYPDIYGHDARLARVLGLGAVPPRVSARPIPSRESSSRTGDTAGRCQSLPWPGGSAPASPTGYEAR